MTGTIVNLAAGTRTGTIRAEDGSRLAFTAAVVLGDFDSLAVGHRVSFELDRAGPNHSPVTVFRTRVGGIAPVKRPDALPDLRYAGFSQQANVRSYRFSAAARGEELQEFVVTVDLALMTKHHIAVQEAPALCLRKLAADLKGTPGSAQHDLSDGDMLAFASNRAAAIESKKLKHSFAGRRRPAPPSPAARGRV